MALCTQEDVENKLQVTFDNDPDAVIAALITDAQAEIEQFIGRTVESASRSETLDGGVRALFLRYWPVTAISSVSEDGTSLTVDDDYKFYENGIVIRVSGGYPISWRTTKPKAIDVSYTGGFKTPDHDSQLNHLGSICAEIVARAFRLGQAGAELPAGAAGGIQSITLSGSDTVTYATGTERTQGLTQFVYLADDEMEKLTGYRSPPFV